MTFPGHEVSSPAARPSTPHDDGVPVALTRRELRAQERAMVLGAGPEVGRLDQRDHDVVVVSGATPAAAGSRRALRAERVAVESASAQPAKAQPAVVQPAVAQPSMAQPSTDQHAPSIASSRRQGPKPSVRAVTRTRRAAALATPVVAPRPASRSTSAQRTRRFGVLGAMVFVGATIVSTSVPANAYFVDTPENVAVKLVAAAQSGTTVGGTAIPAGGQEYVASGSVDATAVGRDGYSVTNLEAKVKATGTGAFTNDSSAAVQWPFAVGVPISSGFGARQVANCGFCSTFHQGLDFIPGAGTPIQNIADGTVVKVEQGGGALGYNVWIEHSIGGKTVTSVYAHMMAGSIKVTQGESVKVGQLVGLVGSTGNSTGAHLHFEIHLDGVPVDPYPWLQANAGVQ